MLSFTTYGTPLGKPRMTRRDTWKQRPCVVRYWQWCDLLRKSAGLTEKVTFVKPHRLTVIAYFPLPDSWSARVRKQAMGQPHAHKPDVDNVAKGVMDALLEQDQNIYSVQCVKLWDDGNKPRVEVLLEER